MMTNTTETVPVMPAFQPLSVENNSNFSIVELEAPKVAFHINEDIEHPKHWEGYIKVETAGTYTFSATIDDNGYIELGGQKIVELTGMNSQTLVISEPILLAAGYHWIKLHQENGASELVQAGYPNAEAFIPQINSEDIKLFGIVASDSRYPVSFEVSFNSTRSVLNSQKDYEASTHAASGFVFEGNMKVMYNDDTYMNIPVQSGGWMATSSPWTNGIAKDNGVPILAPPNTGTYNVADYPDTACPATCYQIRTPYKTNNVGGYEIVNVENQGSEHPDYLRSGLVFHIAKRIGSEGCISTFDHFKWGLLRSEMRLANKLPAIPSLSIQFTGVTPNPCRQPNSN